MVAPLHAPEHVEAHGAVVSSARFTEPAKQLGPFSSERQDDLNVGCSEECGFAHGSQRAIRAIDEGRIAENGGVDALECPRSFLIRRRQALAVRRRCTAPTTTTTPIKVPTHSERRTHALPPTLREYCAAEFNHTRGCIRMAGCSLAPQATRFSKQLVGFA